MDPGKLEPFARAGYCARAIVYFLLGYLTLATAHSEGTRSVLDDIRALPLGIVILIATGIGLAGYGIFRAVGAFYDIQGEGTGAMGLGKRAGHVLSGLAHLGLAVLAFKFVFAGGDPSSSHGGRMAAKTAMSFPGGDVAMLVVGICFALAAINQGTKAATGKFMRLIDRSAPFAVEVIGRIGYAARAIVFGALAWRIIASGMSDDAEKLGFQSSLSALRNLGWLYSVVAGGLLVFGVFSLAMARYRRVADQDLPL